MQPLTGTAARHGSQICLQCRLRLLPARSTAARRVARFTAASRPPCPPLATPLSIPSDYFSKNSQLSGRPRDRSLHKVQEFFRSSQPLTKGIATTVVTRSLRLQTAVSQDPLSKPNCQQSDESRTSSILSKPKAHTIPPDASSQLSKKAAKLPTSSFRRQFASYLALSKPRLTFLMVLTTASAYSLYPTPWILTAASTATPSLSALTLVFLTSGTALCSASANALNMLIEPAYDAQMSRTRNRPLVRGLISSRGAFVFALIAGVCGVAGLYYGVNPTTAFLGGTNIVLYAAIYTPMKRISVLNTWIGAVVGAIPPLMGWAAAAGQHAVEDGSWRELLLGPQNYGGWLLASLLFAWQFPHFNALSWTIREEYKAAGYRMMAWVNESRNARIALRYSFVFFPICIGLHYVGVTDRGFIVSSSLLNAWALREAWKFYKYKGSKGSARSLFFAGVWQLPGLLALAMAHKAGLWEGLWFWWIGEGELGEEALDEDEDRTRLQRSSL